MRLWISWFQKLSAILSRVIRSAALLFIFVYRNAFSFYLGGRCRFEPSCSKYAEQAFKEYPVVTALWMTLRRLSKCHPLGPYGLDPVPERKIN